VDINIYYTINTDPSAKKGLLMICKEIVTTHCENDTKRILAVSVHQNAASLLSSLLKWTVRLAVKCKPILFQCD